VVLHHVGDEAHAQLKVEVAHAHLVNEFPRAPNVDSMIIFVLGMFQAVSYALHALDYSNVHF
jgi:hypothetical protein